MSSRLLDRLCHVVTTSQVATPANARIATSVRASGGMRSTVAVSRSRIRRGDRAWSVLPVAGELGHLEHGDGPQPADDAGELGSDRDRAAPLQLLVPTEDARVAGPVDGADVGELTGTGDAGRAVDVVVGGDHQQGAHRAVAVGT